MLSEELPDRSGGLEVRQLTVRFGGLTAVDGVSLQVPVGSMTGLIGPNGAGKTTTFNACSGLIQPAEGTVVLHGHDITRATPAQRARMGLGRTFQRMELFDRLSVADNLRAGAEAALTARRSLLGTVFSTRQESREVDQSCLVALELCGIAALADQVAGTLSTGQRRLVELARALAGRFRILLLDEPSSGLDTAETEHFASILRCVATEREIGLLLVEHDMSLVRSLCSYTYVIEFGKLLAEGPTERLLQSDVVRAAYLGGEEVPC